MKPLGLTADLKMVRPSGVEDDIWDAVQSAHLAGWTVDKFRRECAEAWDQCDKDARDDNQKAWT